MISTKVYLFNSDLSEVTEVNEKFMEDIGNYVLKLVNNSDFNNFYSKILANTHWSSSSKYIWLFYISTAAATTWVSFNTPAIMKCFYSFWKLFKHIEKVTLEKKLTF
jgi:hypothetical protein